MSKVRVYPFPVEPEKYAWFDKRPFPVITRKALDNKIQFSSLRGFRSELNVRAKRPIPARVRRSRRVRC